jgi:hypothetical protein
VTEVSSRVRALCALLMCLMVLLFATQTKTAMYKVPSPTVRTLTASKFWKDGQTQNISIPSHLNDDVPFWELVLVLFSFSISLKREFLQERLALSASFLDLEGINHFHRPPPPSSL